MGKKEPLISVVVPVYNGEQYVVPCIENLLSQTYRHLEIIVVDDGSTDRTLELAHRYPVRVLAQEKRGVSAARNAGMDAATGVYLHFMDVDDALNEMFYEKMLAAITGTDADVACCCMIHGLKPHRTTFFPERQSFTDANDKFRITYAGRWGNVCRYLFRTDFLRANRLRFEEFLIAAEDLILVIQAVFLSRKLVTVPGAVYTYIRRENSTMTRTDRAHRRRRYHDRQYAKAFRQQYARQHGFKIPGVPTGRFLYWYVKWLT
jgi:glycosyltransferase involved in cell wall biosynthesis